MEADKEDTSTLGKRVAAARKALGITQTELAARMGCSKQAVSKWERDAADDISKSLFMRLAEELQVSPQWLVGGERRQDDQDGTPSTLGHRITAARQRIGITQTELAHLVGCSPQAVSKWETGQGETVRQDYFMRLTEVLHVSPQWLSGVEQSALPGQANREPVLKPAEARFMALYRQLPAQAQEEVERYAGYLLITRKR